MGPRIVDPRGNESRESTEPAARIQAPHDLPTTTHVAPESSGGGRSGPGAGLAGAGSEAGWLTSCGRFRVLRQHARGGLGRIYVARDEQLGREVALKEIHPEHADDSTSRSRFLLEAEVSGCLEHPGIVPVYALGRYEDGRPYYAMRFIRGKSLREVAIELHERSNPGAADGRSFVLAVRPLVRCLIDVCNAMAYAHCRGVIHRDLKPANIMLGPYGETMIVDWGLAKVLKSTPGDTREAAGSEERARSNVAHAVEEALAQDREAWVPQSSSGSEETQPGRAVGTPAFMSPEQAAGDAATVGPASDVYSLGATLYMVLTGRPPFVDGEAPTVIGQVQSGSFTPPRAIAPRIPRALEAICLRAMARRPERRYPSMKTLADDLERWEADEPVDAYRERWPVRLARWARRHRSWTLAAAVTVLAIVTVLGLTADRFRRAAESERAAREQALRVAARFAARTVAAEVDRRWRILESVASHPRFVGAMQQAEGKPVGSPQRVELQRTLEEAFERHRLAADATNWSLTDATGVQVARVPNEANRIGVNFAYRDYFHGQGTDLPMGTTEVRPIDHPHRSIVFRSRTTGRFVVSFSVPVRDVSSAAEGASGDREGTILGVLLMSVDLGRFSALQLDLGRDQIAVLADLRPDQDGRRGLILHHPAQAEEKTGASLVYLPEGLLDPLDALRRAVLARSRGRGRQAEGDGGPAQGPQPMIFRRAYLDPMGGEYSGRWQAAFEPVIVEGRPDMIDDTGWVVIVQERAPGGSAGGS